MNIKHFFTHASGYRFALLFVPLAVMAAVLGGSSVRTAAAQAASDTQPYVLELRELQVEKKADVLSDDEAVLRVDGRKVWASSMNARRPVEPNFAPIVFVDHIDIKLIEEDSGLNFGDDNLGTWRVYWDDVDGRTDDVDARGPYLDNDTVSAKFTEQGTCGGDCALYYLTYKVRPATQADIDAAGFCNGQEGVYLYEHDNYRGRCTRLTADVSNLKSSWAANDAVTSIRFVGCYAATLYEHSDYEGDATRFDTEWTAIHETEVGNDEASSVVVERTC